MLDFMINILSTPAILVGLMALLGLALQGKPIEDITKGTVKTIVGFLVLTAGSSFLQTGSLNAFGDIFNYAFGMQGVVPNNEAIVSLGLKDFATDTAYIMCIGMIANIIMARFSRMNYIFLTGHHTLYMACMLAVILNVGGLLNVGSETQTHWAVWAITSGLSFAGGVYIILSGVRLIIGEIVPAFRGIAEKLVPNAKPALDCPVVFPYAPNAVLIGFLVSFLGGIFGLFILGFIDASFFPVALILPGVIPHFFCGASAGVFANAEGGLKGCVFGSFLHGLLITFLPAICMPVMGSLNFANCTFSDADFSVAGIILGNVAQFIQNGGLFVVCIIIFLLPIIYHVVMTKKNIKSK